MPCSSEEEVANYKAFLQNLVHQKTGSFAKELSISPHPPWLDSLNIPEVVQQKAAVCDLTISQQQWSSFNPLQRFALIKLSRPSHENQNFVPALKEFIGLV